MRRRRVWPGARESNKHLKHFETPIPPGWVFHCQNIENDSDEEERSDMRHAGPRGTVIAKR
jgi:hypothetical protein